MRTPLRVAVVGAGDFGRRHIAAIQAMPEFELAGVAEPRPAAYRSDEHSVRASFPELLAEQTLDAAVIATPPGAHARDVHLAVAAGLFVLVEKPVVTAAQDVAALAGLGPDVQRRIVPAHISRFTPDFATLREHFASRPIRFIRAIRQVPRERIALHGEEHPALAAMVHDFDLIRALVPAELTSVRSSQRRTQPGLAHPDVVSVDLEFADGTMASVVNTWTLPHSLQYIDARLEVVGDGLTATLILPAGGLRLSTQHGDEIPSSDLEGFLYGMPVGALANELRHFAGIVRGEVDRPAVTLEDALWTIRLAREVASQAPAR
ncbi:MAG: Gfo/Idh/MocA family oxidoreductase [Propionicimonas sp.]